MSIYKIIVYYEKLLLILVSDKFQETCTKGEYTSFNYDRHSYHVKIFPNSKVVKVSCAVITLLKYFAKREGFQFRNSDSNI